MAHILLAADADWVIEQVQAALGDADTRWTVCRAGRDVVPAIARAVAAASPPDLAVLDLQIGTMGGMAVCLDMRLEQSAGRLPHIPVIMLLDRTADVFLARRSAAEGWIVKPLEPVKLRRAARVVMAGGRYGEHAADPVADGANMATG